MNRDDYRSLKTSLKEDAKKLSSMKRLLREDMSSRATVGVKLTDYTFISTFQMDVNAAQRMFRIRHIFMSLLRGRTRTEIENNFESQGPSSGLYSPIERGLKDLCNHYGLEPNLDEKYRVISIIRQESKQEVA